MKYSLSPPDGDMRGRWKRTPRSDTMPPLKRQHKRRGEISARRRRDIAVLDMETDQFNAVTQALVYPFLAILYSDQFEPVIIWEDDHEKLVSAIIRAIEKLPRQFTIYAHNGGRFDFMFLVHRLRGDVKFKGRGIMSARIGEHELRDSFHIIPEKLASFQKDIFDYTKLERGRRMGFQNEIIAYCLNDCTYLFDVIQSFVEQFGLKLTIGQAAMAAIKKEYPSIDKFSAGFDAYVRRYYFGGRVECLQGAGDFNGDYKLLDVNSMYAYAMAKYRHPIGGFHDYKITRGPITADTFFIKLECTSRGAFLARGESGENRVLHGRGEFFVTIHEYIVAVRYGLISDARIVECLDCARATSFEKFVDPLYGNRIVAKSSMAEMRKRGLEQTSAYLELKKDDTFNKLILNNGYGKFCQNPERFKEHYITDPDDEPESKWFDSLYEAIRETDLACASAEGEELYVQKKLLQKLRSHLLPLYESEHYWIWSKPSPSCRYNNVGTGASITGAARAVLLEALQHTSDAVYCDTDSIICKDFDAQRIHMHSSELGAWDLEGEFSRVVVAGKKLYGVWHKKPKVRTASELERGLDPCYTIKSKGTAGLTWPELLSLLDGAEVNKTNFAPTLTKFGDQYYIGRNIRATAGKPQWLQTLEQSSPAMLASA